MYNGQFIENLLLYGFKQLKLLLYYESEFYYRRIKSSAIDFFVAIFERLQNI